MSLMFDDENIPYIQIGKYRIRLDKEDLDEPTKKKAEKELREYPDIVEKALIELRTLIDEEENLYVPSEMEDYLIKFLRPCKFYANSAFQQMQMFYKFKHKYPAYCNDLLPSKERNVFSHGIISLQELRNTDGCRIMTIQSGYKWKPSLCSLQEIFRGVQLSLESAMVEPKTQVNGVVVILDMKGFTLNHAVQITPSLAKMVVEWVQDCIPLRLKGVHIVNQPYIFNMVFALFKPFLREKLRNRIHFHGGNRESLHNFIPPTSLVPDFGGTMEMPDLNGNLLCDLFCKYEDDFKLADSFGYDKNQVN